MNDIRCWSKEIITDFIKLYQDNPCLWKVKSRDYSNRKLRNDAYYKLVKFCKPVFPEADKEFVIKKIQSLRGSFRKEMKKANIRQNGYYEEAYIPSLWYFDLLLFTKDQDLSVTNNSSLKGEDMFDAESNGSFNDDGENALNKPKSFEEVNLSIKYSPPRGVKRKSIRNDDREKFMKTSSALKSNDTPGVSEYEAIAINISKKLQRMNQTQAIYSETLINSILCKGLLNKLTSNTIVTETSPEGYQCVYSEHSSQSSSPAYNNQHSCGEENQLQSTPTQQYD